MIITVSTVCAGRVMTTAFSLSRGDGTVAIVVGAIVVGAAVDGAMVVPTVNTAKIMVGVNCKMIKEAEKVYQ